MKKNIGKFSIYFDTSSNKENAVILYKNGKILGSMKSDMQSSQVLVPMIEKILKKNKVNLNDLKEIKVNTGPGSFTGLRVGISVANTISLLLRIPLNGKMKRILNPKYK
jgi:tRNA threonylcarbamoyladenosine biosynthesis protein TsaB